MTPIKVKVNWFYPSPRQYKPQLFEFEDEKHYANWFIKSLDEKIRKIINLEEL